MNNIKISFILNNPQDKALMNQWLVKNNVRWDSGGKVSKNDRSINHSRTISIDFGYSGRLSGMTYCSNKKFIYDNSDYILFIKNPTSIKSYLNKNVIDKEQFCEIMKCIKEGAQCKLKKMLCIYANPYIAQNNF